MLKKVVWPSWDQAAESNWTMNDRSTNRKFISLAVLVAIIVTLALSSKVHTRSSSRIDLKPGPYTKADLPLLREKSAALKADAKEMLHGLSHLKNRDERALAQKAWTEAFYTEEMYPASARARELATAQIVQWRPELAEEAQQIAQYQDERYRIATKLPPPEQVAATEKLDEGLGKLLNSPKCARLQQELNKERQRMVGDPEYDKAETASRHAYRDAALKRYPQLAGYFDEMEACSQGYAHLMAQANALDREVDKLENLNPGAKVEVQATKETGASNTPIPAPIQAQVSTPAPQTANLATNAVTATPAKPEVSEAAAYGVKVGDAVAISALKPAVTLSRATITAMDNSILTVRNDTDVYRVRWDDVLGLRVVK